MHKQAPRPASVPGLLLLFPWKDLRCGESPGAAFCVLVVMPFNELCCEHLHHVCFAIGRASSSGLCHPVVVMINVLCYYLFPLCCRRRRLPDSCSPLFAPALTRPFDAIPWTAGSQHCGPRSDFNASFFIQEPKENLCCFPCFYEHVSQHPPALCGNWVLNASFGLVSFVLW